MTVRELYNEFCSVFPKSLSCEWDNDGLMCCRDDRAEVRRVLCTLDVNDMAAEYAINGGYDLIVSHHPLIFHPLRALTPDSYIAARAMKLMSHGISVMSFHTRADAAPGGVNDALASALGITVEAVFGNEGEMLGRIGTLAHKMTLSEFCEHVKNALGSHAVLSSDGGREVHRVALVGGDGKDFTSAALAAGADTYVSGRLSYNIMAESSGMGLNLVEAGHYYTEAPVLRVFGELISRRCPDAQVGYFDSNAVKINF